MDFIKILGIISAVITLVVTILYSYQVIYLFLVLFKRREKPTSGKQLRYAVLIAARNEEAVLPHLLDSICAQSYPRELIDIYVVADNCTDRTAEVARAHGATVYERFNKEQIGKGFAIDYLVGNIRKDFGWEKYDAFLIFDADNLLDPEYITNMNKLVGQGYQAFCGYRNTKNFGTNWITSSYALWYLHESSHMNRSRTFIGVGSHVNGTGFGFTREVLEQIGGWKFFTLTEDLEFNDYCVTHGIKTGYCHDAILYDEQPLTFRQSWKQRTRWIQGGFQVSLKYGAALFKGLVTRLGWTAHTCMELLTLSLWGYGLSGLAAVLGVVLSALTLSPVGFAISIGLMLLGAYCALAFMGFWTVLLEWKRIRATKGRKILSIFTFPIFMMTFVPIAIIALFRKYSWEPIEHTVAISATELTKK